MLLLYTGRTFPIQAVSVCSSRCRLTELLTRQRLLEWLAMSLQPCNRINSGNFLILNNLCGLYKLSQLLTVSIHFKKLHFSVKTKQEYYGLYCNIKKTIVLTVLYNTAECWWSAKNCIDLSGKLMSYNTVTDNTAKAFNVVKRSISNDGSTCTQFTYTHTHALPSSAVSE